MISIIVPVYKAEKYLHRCVNSVINQTYRDWELILIDDGSPDASGKICDDYASKDERIIVQHNENKGANFSRKVGVNIAKGEWLTFLDSDDTLPIDALKNYAKGISQKVDIIVGSYNSRQFKDEFIHAEEYQRLCVEGKDILVAPWAHLFRSSLFDGTVFNTPREVITGEDWLMNVRIAFKTTKDIHVLSNIVYEYSDNPDSITHTNSSSLDRWYLFFSLLQKAIPEEKNNLLIYHIDNMIRCASLYALQHKYESEWVSHPYMLELRSMLSKYNVHLSFFRTIILFTKHAFIRLIIISVSTMLYKCKILKNPA